MKYLVLFLVLCTSVTAYATPVAKLTGKWKEITRHKGDTALNFKDTIHIEFLANGSYIWQKDGGYAYKGSFTITDKALDMGARYFTIISRTPDKLVIQDDAGKYELVVDNKVAVQNVLPTEAAPQPVTSIDKMIGNWAKYKVTNATPQSTIDYTRVLKRIIITGGSSDGKLGYVYAAKDIEGTPSWYIESFSNQTLYCNGKDKRTFKVIKCQDNDMVIEEDGVTYFFRQFK